MIRIATFNLDGFGGRDGEDRGEHARLDGLRKVLTALGADVLCLQEVNAQPRRRRAGAPRALVWLDRLLAGTPYARFDRSVSRREAAQGPLDVHNLVTLSGLPMLADRQIWHDLLPAPTHRAVTARPGAAAPAAYRWDRPSLLTEIGLADGRTLHVFNMHLRAPLAAFIPGQKEGTLAWATAAGWAEGFYLATLKRAGQALEVRLAIDRVFDRDAAALVLACGDLNADATEMPVRILEAHPSDTGNPALAARALTPIERIVPEADRYSVVHAGRRHLLDHILVSRTVAAAIAGVEIRNEGLRDEVLDDVPGAPRTISNHAPIVAAFDL